MQNEIEQMAKAVCHLDRNCDECMTSFECKAMMYAKRFYNAGYRKAFDVAREIFEEADKIFMATCLSLETYKAWCELKKKYTESSNEITEGGE